MLQAPPRRKSRPDLVFYKTPLNPSRIFSQNTLSWIAIQIFFRKPLNQTGLFSQNRDPNIFIKPPKTVNHLQYSPSCYVPPTAHIPGRRRRVNSGSPSPVCPSPTSCPALLHRRFHGRLAAWVGSSYCKGHDDEKGNKKPASPAAGTSLTTASACSASRTYSLPSFDFLCRAQPMPPPPPQSVDS